MGRFLLMLCVFATGLAQAQVKGEAGGVYIAGEAFSLEQAAADALRDRSASPSDPMSVLVLRSEVRKLSTGGATSESRGLADKLQAARVPIYVCERDAKAAGLATPQLLPGVRVERGWTREEALANVGEREPDKRRTPEAMLRRIRRLCAEG